MLKLRTAKSWVRFTVPSVALLSLLGAQLPTTAAIKTELTPVEKQQLGRIVGGTVAPNGAYPWMVSLQTSSGFHFCGGTLISRTKVLTAAHCTNLVSNAQIRVGSNLVTKGQLIAVQSQVRHPKFNGSTFDYDVAIWTLAKPAQLSDKVDTVDLPRACNTLDCGITKPGTKLRTIGWGTLTEGGSSPRDLRQVDVPVVSNRVCNQPVSYAGSITTRMLCAGLKAGGKDSCQGDSGGPLFQYTRAGKKGLQAGIVSFGDGCARPDKFGVYTRITNKEVRDFIKSNAGV
jgi:secreted trypsin-like serine protease